MTQLLRLLVVLLAALVLVTTVLLYSQREAALAGSGWVAKRVCSGVFVADRDPDALTEASLPLPLPIPIPAEIDRDAQTVTAYFARFFAPSTARYRAGLGCTLDAAEGTTSPLDGKILPERTPGRPLPERLGLAGFDEAIGPAFEIPANPDDEGPTPQTRAVVVLHHGAIVAERYATGFSAATPLPGWSMTKSITSTLIGLLAQEARVDVMAPVGLEEWSDPSDPRHNITWDQLLRMSSGLAFSEDYSAIDSDAIRMLFGRDRFDRGRYAALRPLEFEPDTFWSYSSGTTNLLQYALLHQVFDGDLDRYLRFPGEALFGPVGMTSAVLEPDASGVFVGSSHLLATARDWARYGQLYLDRGRVAGRSLLAENWVDYTARPTPTNTDGTYGAHWWLNAEPTSASNEAERRFARLDPNIFMASGFEGQYVVVVPNDDLVIVRLGLDRGQRVDLEGLVARVVDAARRNQGPAERDG